MKFYEWWYKQLKDPTNPISPREAWNSAIEVAAKIVESRGVKIGGAIQPEITAREIRDMRED